MVSELSALLRPHQLAGSVNSTEEVAEGTCAVLRQSLSGIGSIEQVLTTLTVLNVLLAEDASILCLMRRRKTKSIVSKIDEVNRDSDRVFINNRLHRNIGLDQINLRLFSVI